MDINIFSFNHPLILLVIIPAAALTIYLLRNMGGLSNSKRKLTGAIRLIVLVLLIFAISGFNIRQVSNSTTTIFALDISDSTYRHKTEIEDFVKDAFKNKKHQEKAGIVVFGANATVETIPTANPFFDSIQSKINANYTNIEQALGFASSLIPGSDRKRIVLVTDGEENMGDSLKLAGLLNNKGIVVDVMHVKQQKSQEVNEVQIKEVTIPEVLHKGEKFEVTVKVDSTVKTKGSLKLYADRQLAAERSVEIDEGMNTFVFSGTAGNGGLVVYTAVIEPEDDGVIKNNSMAAFSHIKDIPEILVIQNKSGNVAGNALGSASELIRIFEKDVKVRTVEPENVPKSLEDMLMYQAFIISDVSAEELDERFLNNLEICIKHQGKGLLVTGGENSYALGGYYETPLEKVLPVNMDITPKEESPNLGLVLVIDKSGSMTGGQYGVSKVELAKEAAIRSTEVLTPRDMIGVIAFDSAAQWVVKTQKLDNLPKIQDDIGTIRAGGGTQILPPLEEAYLSLKNADTKLKHIILLTDGEAEKTGYEPLIDKINAAGITLSTVAVGQSADMQLLNALAAGGKGRFYMTDEFSHIPKIFAKETFLAGKTYLNNRVFAPGLKSQSEILKGIDSIPVLEGYVGTTAKNTAQVVFASDTDQPILAVWQYGLGRTAAWTPDVKGAWTRNWMKWEQSPLFWKNVLSWIIQRHSIDDYSIKGGLYENYSTDRSTDKGQIKDAGGIGAIEVELPNINDEPISEPMPESILESISGQVSGQVTGQVIGQVTKPASGPVIGPVIEPVIEAVIVSPSGKEQQFRLQPISRIKYEGIFQADETGIYLASINVKYGTEIVKNINTGISIPYSPEYNISRVDNLAFLQKLAYEGGGRILGSGAEVFKGDPPPVAGNKDMTNILIALSIIVFVLEIGIRRLNLKLDAATERMTQAAHVIQETKRHIKYKYVKNAFPKPGSMEQKDSTVQYVHEEVNIRNPKIKGKNTTIDNTSINENIDNDNKNEYNEKKDNKDNKYNKDNASSHLSLLLEKKHRRNKNSKKF
ncbi:MAG TPA: VWA domain-containing protein [Clostridiales bacterium]|nr:VWA domain-containing protein [Clostridiales bacterium]